MKYLAISHAYSCNKYYLFVNIRFLHEHITENVVCRIDRYSSDADTKVYGNRSAFFLEFLLRFKQASIYIVAAMNTV